MELPRGMGPLRLELISRVWRDDQGHLSLFAPLVLILDETGAIQRRFDWREFTYQPTRGLNDDRLYLSFGITPSARADRLVVPMPLGPRKANCCTRREPRHGRVISPSRRWSIRWRRTWPVARYRCG